MSRGKRDPTPRYPLLRQTVARLLFAAPALALVGCSHDEWECIHYDAYDERVDTNRFLPDGGIPTSENCLEVCRLSYPNTKHCTTEIVLWELQDGGTFQSPRTYCDVHISAGCQSDGRQPEGLRAAQVDARCTLGCWFARMAWMEAASVPAFLRLARELAHHGAPAELVRAARRSAGEEVRHARAAGALARRHGTAVPEVELPPFGSRSLEAMLLENAREGCVRETFGAVVAGWQARTARDEQVRETMSRIARDELRHAELAWAVEAWAAERLTPEEHQRVRDARLAAFHELKHLVEGEEPEAVLVQAAGLPPRDVARQFLQGLQVLSA